MTTLFFVVVLVVFFFTTFSVFAGDFAVVFLDATWAFTENKPNAKTKLNNSTNFFIIESFKLFTDQMYFSNHEGIMKIRSLKF